VVDDLFEVSGGGDVVLRLHVQPGAGRTAVVGRHGDSLKVRVAAPPEGGRANEAVVGLVAETLGAAAAKVELVSGASSRAKQVRVAGMDVADVRRRLEAVLTSASVAPGRRPTGRESRGPRIR